MTSIGLIHTTVGTTVSSTLTSFAEVVESDDLVDGTTYYVICHALCEGSTTLSFFEWQLYDNTNGEVVADSAMKRKPTTADETQSYSFIGKIVAGASGGGISFQQKSASLQTVRTQFVSMIFMDLSNLQSSDYFFDSNSVETAHTDAFVTSSSSTIASPTNGDTWLVFGWASTAINNTAKQSQMRLSKTLGVAQVTTPLGSYEGKGRGEKLNWWACRPYVLTGGSTLLAVQVRDEDDTGEDNSGLASSIFGLRLNAFQNFSAEYTDAETTTTAVTFQELDSLDFTPKSTNTIVTVASAIFAAGSASIPVATRIQVGGTTSPNTQPDTYFSARSNDGADLLPLPYVTTYSGSIDTEATIDFNSKKTTSADIGWKEYALASFSSVIVPYAVNYSAIASQTFSSGEVASQAYNSGEVASQTFASGDVASEVNPL